MRHGLTALVFAVLRPNGQKPPTVDTVVNNNGAMIKLPAMARQLEPPIANTIMVDHGHIMVGLIEVRSGYLEVWF